MKKDINNRLHLIDTIRGITILSMIIFHTVWDLVYIYGINLSWYYSDYAYIWQQSICWTFIFISGFCFSFSKNKFKRGIIVFISGILVTLVTAVFMSEDIIIFGILTLIGSAMIILSFVHRFLGKLPPVIFSIISFLLFFITKDINNGHLGFEGLKILKLPDFLYKNLFTSYLGFTAPHFSSSDYFSLLPWIFLFVCGYFVFKVFEKHDALKTLKGKNVPVINFIGRHSLLIYLLHQPLIYGVTFLIFN